MNGYYNIDWFLLDGMQGWWQVGYSFRWLLQVYIVWFLLLIIYIYSLL